MQFVLLFLYLCIISVGGFSNDFSNFKKPSEKHLRSTLSPIQYKVTQEDGTERAFKNEYWSNKKEGIYVDIVSGEPLFSSTDKYDSKTGWPSFKKPISDKVLVYKTDKAYGMTRTEVRSKYADSHLGHVFNDGPKPSGKRYCINSASLRFISKNQLMKNGYGEYMSLFKVTQYSKAAFAGGCFWCMEPPFERLEGVKSAISGYMGGKEPKPTYEKVSQGLTGHAEVVEVTYDPNSVSYEKLLETFLMNIDPTDSGGQFADRGSQYRPEIFYYDDLQKDAAGKALQKLAEDKIFQGKIVVKITEKSSFWPAEDYHQDYYKKNPEHYNRYKEGSGRGPFIRKFWKK